MGGRHRGQSDAVLGHEALAPQQHQQVHGHGPLLDQQRSRLRVNHPPYRVQPRRLHGPHAPENLAQQPDVVRHLLLHVRSQQGPERGNGQAQEGGRPRGGHCEGGVLLHHQTGQREPVPRAHGPRHGSTVVVVLSVSVHLGFTVPLTHHKECLHRPVLLDQHLVGPVLHHLTLGEDFVPLLGRQKPGDGGHGHQPLPPLLIGTRRLLLGIPLPPHDLFLRRERHSPLVLRLRPGLRKASPDQDVMLEAAALLRVDGCLGLLFANQVLQAPGFLPLESVVAAGQHPKVPAVRCAHHPFKPSQRQQSYNNHKKG
mmetsp:Transcript_55244/g.133797  ORF Transcript_55244/g.133797 Transcript_55244/m.133797 type:complete len:312 (-) Transcript_55244:46-981(-)